VIHARLPNLRARRVPGFDVLLAGLALAVAAFGVLMVYSATRPGLIGAGSDPHYYLKRQALFVVLGLLVMLGVSRLDYRRLEQIATPAYVLSILALLAVRYTPFGSNALGSQRWFNFHFIQVQPSEFTVLAMILAIATYCERRPDGLSMRDVWRLLLMAGLPIFLVYLQPDLGTAIIMVVVLMVMLAIAGVPPRFLFLMTVVASGIAVLAVVLHVLAPYQWHRIVGFLQQNQYQTTESKIAIGAGGLWGTGLFQGISTHGYIPEQQTDFIFSVVGSQLGFIGASGLIVALGAISTRMLRASMLAKDHLGRLLAVGIFTFFAFSCFQNVGMIMGLMPVTGIPLPFMSYGGSAAVCFFLAVGIVLSVTNRRPGVAAT
jgi:rod shape determining protein RodA